MSVDPPDLLLEGFGVDEALADPRHRTGHVHGEPLADADGERPTRHVDRDVAIHQPEPAGHRRGGAAGAARGERVAGPPLPDLELDVLAVQHLQELHVGAVGEARLVLDERAVLAGQRLGDLRQGQHAVGVPDAGGREGEGATAHGELLVQDLARPAHHRDAGAVEGHLAHLHVHQLPARVEARADQAARGLDGEGVGADQLLIEEEAREDAQAVAALLGLAGVRVEDAQPEVRTLSRQRAPQDAVRAHPEVAVADEPDLAKGELAADRAGVHHQVVVAEAVIPVESHGRAKRISNSGPRRIMTPRHGVTRMLSYDVVVIGSGPAGENGAVQAGFLGKRVALVEKEAVPGGASANTGTIPSKALRETALAIQQARGRGAHGIEMRVSGQVTIPELMGRRGLVTGREHSRIRDALNRAGVEQLRGTASFVDAHTLRVEVPEGGAQELHAEVVLLATGTRPFHPPQYAFDHVRVYDSDSILLLDRVPRPLAILGGGVAGCEYASIFAGLGVNVSIIDSKERLLPWLDAEISLAMQGRSSLAGIEMYQRTRAVKLEAGDRDVLVTLSDGSRLVAEKVLVAAGRVGVVDSLDLPAAGLK